MQQKYFSSLWGWIQLLAFKEGILCYSQLVKDNHSSKKSVMHVAPAIIHHFVRMVAQFSYQSQVDFTLYPE